MKVQIYEWLRITQPLTANLTNLLSLPQANGFIDFSIKYFKGTNIGLAYCPDRLFINHLGCFRFVGNDNLQPTIDINTISIKDSDISINGNLISNIRGYKKVNIYAYQNTEADIAISEIKQDNGIFKPCKLLTAYGSHQIGECCMINVLDNTLYFNEGTGAFSVEGEALEVIDTTPCYNNIISKESKVAVRLREWINNNRTSAYINTGIIVTAQTNAEITHQRYEKKGNATLMGARISTERGRFVFWNEWQMNNNTMEVLRVSLGYPIHDSVTYRPYNLNTTYKMSIIGNSIYYDNELIDTVTERDNGSYPLYIFALNDGGTTKYTNGRFRIGEIVFSGDINVHLHPAELALPFGTHQIGECCMIDLNSGDLYFNQGSGSFVCEGAILGYWQDKPMVNHYCDVDGALHRSVQIFADNGSRLKLIWEKSKPWSEHRWLRITDENNASITEYLTTEVSNGDISMFIKRHQGSNSYLVHFLGIGSVIAFSRNIALYGVHTFNADVNDYLDIKTKGDALTINGEEYVVTNGEQKRIWLRGYNNPFDISFRYITQGTLHLIPAILDRPTTAEEDNNNIARKQGEAVFVDEQRYKQGLPWVFGNVASSGSFSVSDYLIEGEDYEVIEGVVAEVGQTIDLKKRIYNVHCEVVMGYDIFYPRVNYSLIVHTIGVNSNGYGFINNIATGERYVSTQKGAVIDIDSTSIKVNELSVPNTADYIDAMFKVQKNQIVICTKFSDLDINLIPVRLKKPIEPTCTHNNKGGSEGEYCFFDTISGRAFVNDGSGKFKRYFEEGKDYETVAGVVGAPHSFVNLDIDITTLEVDVVTTETYPQHFIKTNLGLIYGFYASVRDWQNEGNTWTSPIYIGNVKIIITKTTVKINDYSLNKGYDKLLGLLNATQSEEYGIIKRVYQQGVIDLIPIRLLRTAYESDTHNGKEYASGTICFYDTISGMVYGNDGQGEFSEYVPDAEVVA